VQQYNILKKLSSYLENSNRHVDSRLDKSSSTSMMICCKWLERSFGCSIPAVIAKIIGDVFKLLDVNQQTHEVCCFCGIGEIVHNLKTPFLISSANL